MGRPPTGYYKRIPWQNRPLAMRAMEQMLGEPMETLISAAWFKTRVMRGVFETLGLEDTTCRRWMRLLGIYICARCSKRTGKLHYHTQTCTGCGRWFCDDCIEAEETHHVTEYLDNTFPSRTASRRPEYKRCPN